MQDGSKNKPTKVFRGGPDARIGQRQTIESQTLTEDDEAEQQLG